ncbi:GNAT family N-acetyltransferase, partial [Psittacicella hinzii]
MTKTTNFPSSALVAAMQEVIKLPQELELHPITLELVEKTYPQLEASLPYLAEFLPWAKNTTLSSLLYFSQSLLAQHQAGTSLEFYIYDALKQVYVGRISARIFTANATYPQGYVDYGYYLFQEQQGHGYMQRALTGLRTLIASYEPEISMVVRTLAHNVKSKQVALKSGFVQVEQASQQSDDKASYTFIYVKNS